MSIFNGHLNHLYTNGYKLVSHVNTLTSDHTATLWKTHFGTASERTILIVGGLSDDMMCIKSSTNLPMITVRPRPFLIHRTKIVGYLGVMHNTVSQQNPDTPKPLH